MKTGSSMRDLDFSWPVDQRRERVPIRKETAMSVTRTRTVVLLGASFYLAVMSFAGRGAAGRIRSDRDRGEVPHHYDEAVREWHEFRMSSEHQVAQESFAGADAL